MRRIVITIVFALLLIIYVAIVRKKKLRLSKLLRIITCVAFVALYCLSYLPFECWFVKFDNPEQSLNYCQFDEHINCRVDVTNGAFLICNIGNGSSSTVVHSAEKDGDKWKMLDLHNSGGLYHTDRIESKYGNELFGTLNVHGIFVYNNILNSTIVQLLGDFKSNDINITDGHGNEFTMYSTSSDSIGGYVNGYYIVLDGEPPATITIILNNDEEIEIEL